MQNVYLLCAFFRFFDGVNIRQILDIKSVFITVLQAKLFILKIL